MTDSSSTTSSDEGKIKGTKRKVEKSESSEKQLASAGSAFAPPSKKSKVNNKSSKCSECAVLRDELKDVKEQLADATRVACLYQSRLMDMHDEDGASNVIDKAGICYNCWKPENSRCACVTCEDCRVKWSADDCLFSHRGNVWTCKSCCKDRYAMCVKCDDLRPLTEMSKASDDAPWICIIHYVQIKEATVKEIDIKEPDKAITKVMKQLEKFAKKFPDPSDDKATEALVNKLGQLSFNNPIPVHLDVIQEAFPRIVSHLRERVAFAGGNFHGKLMQHAFSFDGMAIAFVDA